MNHAIYSAVVCRCFLPGLGLPPSRSPGGATCKRQHTSDSSLLLIYRPRKDERLSWPGSARIKQLQEFLKSDHWLRRYCTFSGGVFYFEPPCTLVVQPAVRVSTPYSRLYKPAVKCILTNSTQQMDEQNARVPRRSRTASVPSAGRS